MNALTSQWGIHFLHAAWQSAAVAIMVLIWTRFVRSSRLRHALLLIALAKFALPPMLPLPFGIFSTAPRVGTDVWWPVERFFIPDHSPWSPVLAPLMLLHLLGAMVVALHCLIVTIRGHRALRSAPSADDDIVRRADRIASSLGLSRAPRVLISDALSIPCVTSALNPTIVLPSTHPSEIDDILIHEMAHIRGRDLLVVWSERLLSIAWWWNPLFWLVVAELRRAREERCDDAALLHGADAREYSLALIDFAGASPSIAGIGISSHQSGLERRLRRLADGAAPRAAHLTRLQWAVALLAVSLLLPGMRPSHWPHFTIIERHP